jgi:hypothetical protein
MSLRPHATRSRGRTEASYSREWEGRPGKKQRGGIGLPPRQSTDFADLAGLRGAAGMAVSLGNLFSVARPVQLTDKERKGFVQP